MTLLHQLLLRITTKLWLRIIISWIHHYNSIITSLIHYYIIITSFLHYFYYVNYYCIIINSLLHHYYNNHYYVLLQFHYYLLLHHYYIIITSLLHYYYFIITKGNHVIMIALLHIMQIGASIITWLLRIITPLLHRPLLLPTITHFSLPNLQMIVARLERCMDGTPCDGLASLRRWWRKRHVLHFPLVWRPVAWKWEDKVCPSPARSGQARPRHGSRWRLALTGGGGTPYSGARMARFILWRQQHASHGNRSWPIGGDAKPRRVAAARLQGFRSATRFRDCRAKK